MRPPQPAGLVRRAAVSAVCAGVLAACGAFPGDPSPAPEVRLEGRGTEPGEVAAAVHSAPDIDPCAPPRLPEVVTFSKDGGRCVPVARAVGWRCEQGVPPAILLGPTGTPSRVGSRIFLGGRFAVSLRELPEGARAIGSGRRMRLYVAPAQPWFLAVVADGAITRWTPLRAPRPAPSGASTAGSTTPSSTTTSASPSPTVTISYDYPEGQRLVSSGANRHSPAAWIIGDSIAYGARANLFAELPTVQLTLDAQTGRGSYSGIALAQEAAAAHPAAVVVELGTNDADPAQFRANAEQILTALGGVPLVVWQTPRGPDGDVTMPEIARTVRELSTERTNMVVAEWPGFVPDEAISSDGVHPLPEGTHFVADLIAPYVRGWTAALDGGGAVGCLPG